MPEVSESGSWVEEKLTGTVIHYLREWIVTIWSAVQIRSFIPAHTTSNQAAQDFRDFTASQQYQVLNSDPETEPHVFLKAGF